MALEVNFDGIVGPTHNYAGLSVGNLASQRNARAVSHPKMAALQGLAKMKSLADLGVTQAVLPPQRRPAIWALRQLGFCGPDADVLDKTWRQDPRLLASAYSASSMWAANAAAVSPSADSADGRVHFTPANLISQFHRSLEPPETATVLKAIFADPSAFAHHAPLPAAAAFGDEGAANHTRLSATHGSPGVQVFVYGRSATQVTPRMNPALFPARQTLEASQALARLHRLDPPRVVFAQQHPAAIDAGAFHNDVVSVGNGNVLLHHASAWLNGRAVVEEIRLKFAACSDVPLHAIEVSEDEVPLKDAIATYLFNSQIVTLPSGGMALIAPLESREHPGVKRFIDLLVAASNPIESAHFLDVRQSMRNGGGPACLRLRVVLTERELALVHPGVLLDETLYTRLVAWVGKHYRDELRPEDLRDPALPRESDEAIDALSRILELPPVLEDESHGTPAL
jgi:succinylarginine dihydrolase